MNTILGEIDDWEVDVLCDCDAFLISASSLPTKKFIDPESCSVPFQGGSPISCDFPNATFHAFFALFQISHSQMLHLC